MNVGQLQQSCSQNQSRSFSEQKGSCLLMLNQSLEVVLLLLCCKYGMHACQTCMFRANVTILYMHDKLYKVNISCKEKTTRSGCGRQLSEISEQGGLQTLCSFFFFLAESFEASSCFLPSPYLIHAMQKTLYSGMKRRIMFI